MPRNTSGAAAAIVAAVLLSAGGSSGNRLVQAIVTLRSASAQVRLHAGRAELITRHMPAPPRGKVYEVWIKRVGQPPAPTSALFDVTSSGAATVDVPGDLRGVEEVLVTPERLGGSAVPTHVPVIVARLA